MLAICSYCNAVFVIRVGMHMRCLQRDGRLGATETGRTQREVATLFNVS